MAIFRRLLPVIVALGPFTVRASAQTSSNLTVRVHVIDTAGVAVSDADVAVIRGLQETLGHGTTDANGRASVVARASVGDLQVSVRKLGYTLGTQFFVAPAPPAASISLEIKLHPAPQMLAPVAVTAEQDLKRKSYHIGADEIASSTRPIFDGMDVVRKLRPDMITGRSGDCAVQDVWVNGQRIVFPPPNAMVEARVPPRPVTPKQKSAMSTSSAQRAAPTPLLAKAGMDVWLILASIKPEHIDEMTYEDCFSTKVNKTHANQAIFVVLKPGVGYDPGIGSYVVSNSDSLKSPGRPVTAATASSPAVPSYRQRVLGIFDETTGSPVAQVIVTDSASGTHAETTPTGTVSLAFLPEGESTLLVSKPGFVGLRVPVTISPRDTFPVTVVMQPKPPAPSAMPPGGERTPLPTAPARSHPRVH